MTMHIRGKTEGYNELEASAVIANEHSGRQHIQNGLNTRKIIAGGIVGLVGVSTPFAAGVYVGSKSGEASIEGTVVSQQPPIFSEQKGATVGNIPDSLVRASTVQVSTLCELENKTEAVIEGTGAIYRTKAGQLALGTVTHVVTYQAGGGFNEETPCWIVGTVDLGDRTASMVLDEVDFVGVYKEPTLLRAVMDQPALALLPDDVTAKLEPAIADGLLTPLTTNNRATEKAVMIIRQQNSAGQMSNFAEPQVTPLTIIDAESELLKYKTTEDTNVCSGNSGSPILRVEDGQITNESFGVMSNILGVITETQSCAQNGTVVSYQVER